MSLKTESFPFQQIYNLVHQNQPVSASFSVYSHEISNLNMQWIYSLMSFLRQILSSRQQPHIYCRVLDVLKHIIYTCQYPVIIFIEVYLLPILSEAAVWRTTKSKLEANKYFSYLFKSTEDLTKHSLEFQDKSIELIFLAAHIKPFKTVQNLEVQQPSLFANTIQKLQVLPYKMPQQFKYIDHQTYHQSRPQFQAKLKTFDQSAFKWSEFLMINLIEQLNSESNDLLEIRQLLSFGQCYLISPLLAFIEEELINLENGQFGFKRKCLELFDDLIRFGNIEAVILVKNSGVISIISSFIAQLGPIDEASLPIQLFTKDFLNYLECWVASLPQQQKEDQISLKKIYEILRQQKQLKFAQTSNTTKYTKQVTEAFKKNRVRNQKIISILEKADFNTSHVSKMHKINNMQSKDLATYKSLSDLSVVLQSAKKQLNTLLAKQKDFLIKWKHLQQFKQRWIIWLQSLAQQFMDQQTLQKFLVEADKYTEIIQLITPIVNSYKRGQLDFEGLQNRANEHIKYFNTSQISKQQVYPGMMIDENSVSNYLATLAQKKKNGKKLLTKIKFRSGLKNSQLLKVKGINRSATFSNSHQIRVHHEKTLLEHADYGGMYLLQNGNNINQSNTMVNNSLKQQCSRQQQLNKNEKSKLSKGSNNLFKGNKKSSLMKVESSRSKSQKNINSSVKGLSHVIANNPKNYLEEVYQEADDFIIINDYQMQQAKKMTQQIKPSISAGQALSQFNKSIHKGKLSGSRSYSKIDKYIDSAQSSKTVVASKEQINTQKRTGIKLSWEVQQERKRKNQNQNILFFLENNQLPVETIERNSQKINKTDMKLLEGKLKLQNSQFRDDNNSKNVSGSAQKLQETDQIEGPDLEPQKHSCYIEQQSVESEKQLQMMSFKKIFQQTYFGIDAHQKQIRLLQQKQILKNFIKSPKNYSKTEKSSQVFRTISQQQKNNHNSCFAFNNKQVSAFKSVEKTEKSQFEMLQQRLQELERQKKSMQTKLAIKNNQLHSLKTSSVYGSQKNIAFFNSPNQSRIFQGREDYEMSQKSSNNHFKANTAKRTCQSQFEKTIEKKYRQHLQKFQGSTFKKNLLRNKSLIYNSDELQIGCLSQLLFSSSTQKPVINLTLFLTFHRFDALQFSIHFIQNACFQSSMQAFKGKSIKQKKQHKVYAQIKLLLVPFDLPEIQIKYKSKLSQSFRNMKIVLPLSFNKFVQVKPFNDQGYVNDQLLRTNSFKLNSKVIQIDKLSQYLSGWSLLPSDHHEKRTVNFGGICRYLFSRYTITMKFTENDCLIEGSIAEGKDAQSLQFLLCVFKNIFELRKK